MAELIELVEVHATEGAERQHQIFADLRSCFATKSDVSELMPGWIAAFGAATVALLVNNFLHTESDDMSWTWQTSSSLVHVLDAR